MKCKCNKLHRNTNSRDICMEKICWLINNKTNYKTLASCCGHGKYPMTIVVEKGWGLPLEYFTQIILPRKRRFYKKDKQGIFYIPEVVNDNQTRKIR